MPIACDPGKYCSREELSEPEFDCEAGHYCTSGAKEAKPTDGVTGDICPNGTYCPRGSDAPKNCPIGTFLNSTGNRLATVKIKKCYLLYNIGLKVDADCDKYQFGVKCSLDNYCQVSPLAMTI